MIRLGEGKQDHARFRETGIIKKVRILPEWVGVAGKVAGLKYVPYPKDHPFAYFLSDLVASLSVSFCPIFVQRTCIHNFSSPRIISPHYSPKSSRQSAVDSLQQNPFFEDTHVVCGHPKKQPSVVSRQSSTWNLQRGTCNWFRYVYGCPQKNVPQNNGCPK